MSEHVFENNPKKEFLYAIGGVALFLTIVLIVGISAFLRPADEPITAQATETSAMVDEAEAIAVEEAAATEDGVAAEETTATAEVDTIADATVTPAPESGDAIIAADAGTATADDAVSQAAVADTELTAEQADGDLEAGEVEVETAAQ